MEKFGLVFSTLGLFISQTVFAAQTMSNLYYSTFGDKQNPAIVFLHGGPGYNSYTFEFGAAEELAKSGFYVVVFDQRGCGRSAAGQLSDFTFAKATQDILEVIQTTGVQRPVLLGHSWGGALAIEFLKLHPDVARAALLLDAPVSLPETLFSMTENTIQSFQQKGDSTNQSLAEARLARMFPNGLASSLAFTLDDISGSFTQAMQAGLYQPSKYSPEALAIWKEIGQRPDRQWAGDGREEPPTGFEQNQHLFETDFTNDLTVNRNIIYAAYGSEDRLFDQTQIDKVSELLSPAHVRMLPGAAHYSFIDQRAAFIQAVTDFVSLSGK